MFTSQKRSSKGFTLIELLTVIAIIGILAAIVIPSVGIVRKNARKAVDSNNLRQIGSAALIFATDNRDSLPGKVETGSGPNFGANQRMGASEQPNASPRFFAAALAASGALNDASFWISLGDETAAVGSQAPTSVLNSTKTGFNPDFDSLVLAYGVVAGLQAGAYPSTAPIAFTRGILGSSTGKWSATSGVYRDDGGHIVFMGGNVQSYKTLGSNANNGLLINSNNSATNSITDTILSTKKVRFFEPTVSGGDGSAITPTGS